MSIITSLFIYLLTFFLSIISAKTYQYLYFKNNYKNFTILTKLFWFLIIIFPPAIISSIRYNLGTDYFSYVKWFKSINFNDFNIVWAQFGNEPLYLLLNKIAYVIFDRPWGLFLLSTIIIHFFIVSGLDFFKENISIPFALFIYYSMHFAFGLNAVRQMLAFSIVFFSLKYIYKRDLIKFLLFILIASLFHNTAAICIVFYFLVNSQIKKYNIIRNIVYYFTILISPIILFKTIKIFSKYDYFFSYSKYIKDNFEIGFGFLLYILPIIIPIFIFRKTIINNNKRFSTFIKISLLNIPFTMLGYFINWGQRVALYTNAIYYILVPMLITSVNKKNNKIILTTYYIFIFSFYFLYKFVLKNHSEIFPYITIFNI